MKLNEMDQSRGRRWPSLQSWVFVAGLLSFWTLHRFWPPWSNFPLLLQVEQVSQLAVFIEAALDYHKQSTEILQELQSKLQMR